MNIEEILKQEYIKKGLAPKKIMVNGKPLIVPYIYAQGNRDFCRDFWDINQENEQEYRKRGLIAKKIVYKGQSYIVPLADAKKGLSNAEIAKKVSKKAEKKYRKAILQTILLRKINDDPRIAFYVDRATFACRKNMLLSRLKVNVNFDDIKEFAEDVASCVENIDFRAGVRKAKNFALTSVATFSVAGCAVFAADKIFSNNDERKGNSEKQKLTADTKNVTEGLTEKTIDFLEAERQVLTTNKQLPLGDKRMNFTEKCAGRYVDRYGNLAMLDQAYDDISVLLAMFENYSAEAYDDGWGNKTIGWGITSYLDKYGRSLGKVNPNDRITMEEAVMQKDLYIYYNVVPKLAKVNHAMTEEEVAAFVSVGWWTGPNILQKSSFYKKLLNNDPSCWNSLYSLSEEQGIIKRMGATKEFATGKITSEDLMRLPAGWIYGISTAKYKSGRAAADIKLAATKSSSYRLQKVLPQTVGNNIVKRKQSSQLAMQNLNDNLLVMPVYHKFKNQKNIC